MAQHRPRNNNLVVLEDYYYIIVLDHFEQAVLYSRNVTNEYESIIRRIAWVDGSGDPFSCSWNDYKYREMVMFMGGLTPEKDELARKHRRISMTHGLHDDEIALVWSRCLATTSTSVQPPKKTRLR